MRFCKFHSGFNTELKELLYVLSAAFSMSLTNVFQRTFEFENG